jgi:uncharacterized membrane protein YkgB
VFRRAVVRGRLETLIASRPLSARAALVGSASAVGMFLTTLSFLLTTPGVWEASAGGFPALSVVPGQFLAKDFVLFGASLSMCGEDWRVLAPSDFDGAMRTVN